MLVMAITYALSSSARHWGCTASNEEALRESLDRYSAKVHQPHGWCGLSTILAGLPTIQDSVRTRACIRSRGSLWSVINRARCLKSHMLLTMANVVARWLVRIRAFPLLQGDRRAHQTAGLQVEGF